MIPNQTQVLIIGGGPNGLVASALLSRLGVANVVVERRNGTQGAPAAHVIRQRPLAVLAELGLADEIRAAIPPLDMDYINWVSTLGGPEIGKLDIRDAEGRSLDPFESAWVNLSQNRLEPILARAASSAPEAELFFGVECVGITQRDDRVFAQLRCEDGSEHHIEASWAIAADGAGSPTRSAVGIDMVGTGPLGFGPLGKFFMVHFKAKLSPWMKGRSGPLFWILNPQSLGTVIVHAPDESYVFMTPTSNPEEEEAQIPARLAAALNVSTDIEILSTATWVPFNQVAERYREGRVFLAGDAAHRFPPTGGLGLNTGILDVHNLVWKLALVEAGLAGDRLLDTYEAECRPAALTNANDSFENLKRMSSVTDVLGAYSSLDALVERIESLSFEERTALQRAIDEQRSHFTSDGKYPEPVGSRDGIATTHWKGDYRGFTLFAREVEPWNELAERVSTRVKVPVRFEHLEPRDLSAEPMEAHAFLTRPDGVVMWAAATADGDHGPGMEASLGELLSR